MFILFAYIEKDRHDIITQLLQQHKISPGINPTHEPPLTWPLPTHSRAHCVLPTHDPLRQISPGGSTSTFACPALLFITTNFQTNTNITFSCKLLLENKLEK